jgi:hypothetical protein
MLKNAIFERKMVFALQLEAASDERAARGSCDAGERPQPLAPPAAEGAAAAAAEASDVLQQQEEKEEAAVDEAAGEEAASCASGGGGFTSYVMITQQLGRETCPEQDEPPSDDADRVNVSVLDAEKISINHTTQEEAETAAAEGGGFLTLHLQNEVQIVSNDKTMSQVGPIFLFYLDFENFIN